MTDGMSLLAGILPDVTLKVVHLIKNLGSREPAALQRLQNLEIDLNVIQDVVSEVNMRNSSKDGVQHWAEVAQKTVLQAETLVHNINEKMNTKWRQKVHCVHSYINSNDIKELDNLLKRFDVIKSHNQTILTLTGPGCGLRKREMFALLIERMTSSLRGIS